jgi:hypothetical protein
VESTDYTEAEWAESVGHDPLKDIEDHQVALLHRHWIWANWARRCFEEALAAGEPMDAEQLHLKGPTAMFVWYALLYSVIEGFADRQIPLRGPFNRDLRAVRERLREARHAVFHVGDDDAYYDMRLFRVMDLPNSAIIITRAHKGFGRLLLETMQARRASGSGVDGSAESTTAEEDR